MVQPGQDKTRQEGSLSYIGVNESGVTEAITLKYAKKFRPSRILQPDPAIEELVYDALTSSDNPSYFVKAKLDELGLYSQTLASICKAIKLRYPGAEEPSDATTQRRAAIMKNVVSYIALYISKAGIEVTVDDRLIPLDSEVPPISSEIREFIIYLITPLSELGWNFKVPKGHHLNEDALVNLADDLNITNTEIEGLDSKLVQYLKSLFPINDISLRNKLHNKAKNWIEIRLSQGQASLTTPSGPSEAR